MQTSSLSQSALYDAPISVHLPRGPRAPVVLSSPHSGHHYPTEFIDRVALDRHTLRLSEDAFVEELYQDAQSLGIAILAARFPRAYVDVNRDRREIDIKMLETPNDFEPAHLMRTSRVTNGLGVIARIISSNTPIYKSKLPTQDVRNRLSHCYDTYHHMLRRLIDDSMQQNGYCILVDCHSMPSPKGKTTAYQRADIVLGDRFGQSCNSSVIVTAEKALSDYGYETNRNIPYAGGFITSHYGNPLAGIHTLQIELSRSLYMDEQRLELHNGALPLKRHLKHMVEALTNLPASLLKSTLDLAQGAE